MISEEAVLKGKITAKNMRKNILKLALKGGNNGAHLAPALSIVEIMAALYTNVLNFKEDMPEWEGRDRFILSKGHGALGFYTVLNEAGIISKEKLFTFEDDGGDLPGQSSKNIQLGIEFSGGSLGLGLSYGVGIALAAHMKKLSAKTYVLMGDGEINEGTVWESAMFAGSHKLTNLVAIIDYNNMQSDGFRKDILPIDYKPIWTSFGWQVAECDGHNVEELMNTFETQIHDKPLVVIANTIKGKGVSFMENNKEWHHNKLTEEQYKQAMDELEKGEIGYD